MTKNNFYIITGGPGGGKTSLLENLGANGFKYVSETGRQIIKERLLKGLSPRPESNVFAQQMFAKDLDNYISNSNNRSVIFFDRSFIDSAFLIFQGDKKYHTGIKEILKIKRYNSKVFIAPPWKEIYCTDNERDQTFEEAIIIYERLYKWYEINGYDLIIIPKDSIENRAEFVLTRALK
jgi:predicted ATPase